MGNKSFRIQTTPGSGDKYLKVKLEQDVDMLEILSLKISQKDIYASFNSDFGVLIGRVIANGGVGIPNAKISIFIPITDSDKLNSDILSIYPYTSPRDKNLDGVRYNLLPRVAQNNPFNSIGEYSPKVSLGVFPTKEEISTNQIYMEVFEKYYKYTTVTNNSGDYLLYGIPVGNQTAHLSVDLTDIGKFSMSPTTMVNQLGYSAALFDSNGTKIKFTTDLDTAPNIQTEEIAVDIKPFFGDEINFDIGITRQDFKIRGLLTTSFTIFGTAFTNDAPESRYSKFNNTQNNPPNLFRATDDANRTISIGTKKNGSISADVVRLKSNVDESTCGVQASLGIWSGGTFDTSSDYELIDPSQYTIKTENGNFAVIIPCNRKKIITNEFGQEVEVPFDNTNGIFTEFRGFFVFKMDDPNVPITAPFDARRVKFKIPQNATIGNSFINESSSINIKSENWRKEHFKFEANKIYTTSKYHGCYYMGQTSQILLNVLNVDPFQNVGVLAVDDGYFVGSEATQFPYNTTTGSQDGNKKMFGAEYLNMALFFDVYGHANGDQGPFITNLNLTDDVGIYYYVDPNNNKQLIGGKLKGTAFFQRSDQHRATFVEVPVLDINRIDSAINDPITPLPKGFYSNTPPFNLSPLSGNYPSTTSTQYFFRGLGAGDCIEYIKNLGLV